MCFFSERRLALLFLCGLAALPTCWAGQDKDLPAATKAPTSLIDLSLEVGALQVFRQFQFSPEQVKLMRAFTKDAPVDSEPRPVAKASPAFRKTLGDLRLALIKNADLDKIRELEDKLVELRDKEQPELDDRVEISEAARKHVKELYDTLTARQMVSHLSIYGPRFPDPLDRLIGALHEARGLKEKEWKALREEVSEDVSELVAGLDEAKRSRINDQIVQLLIQARALKEPDFKKQEADLEKTARDIVGKLAPTDLIRHELEQVLAEILSNPRLSAVLKMIK